MLPDTKRLGFCGAALVLVAGCASGGDVAGQLTAGNEGPTFPPTTSESTGSTTGPESTTGASTSGADTSGGDTSDGEPTGGGTGGSTGGSTGGGPVCGDAIVEGDEVCDGSVPPGVTCQTESFADGILGCGTDCALDVTNCTMCGNGTIDDSEDCDGSDLGSSSTCADLGLGTPSELLGCTANCTYDFSNCSGCGDGMVTAPEQCEPPPNEDLNGSTCMSEGFDGGSLSCLAGCTFDSSDCYTCGDGVLNGAEECDINDLGSSTCQTEGFDGGALGCDGTCSFDTRNCYECGDGVRDGPEDCDGSDLGSGTCQSEGFDGGTLACSACTYNTSGCYECGDGVRNEFEVCDGTDVGTETCVGQGYTGGTLGCSAQCAYYDFTNCTGVAPQTVELCEGDNESIPDNDHVGISNTVSVLTGTTIVDVNITQLRINHYSIEDLVVELSHGTTTVNVLEPLPCTRNNIGTDQPGVDLDDEMIVEANEQCVSTSLAIPSGAYNPGPGTLSDFDGQNPQGNWTLRIADTEAGSTGSRWNWCVLITYH